MHFVDIGVFYRKGLFQLALLHNRPPNKMISISWCSRSLWVRNPERVQQAIVSALWCVGLQLGTFKDWRWLRVKSSHHLKAYIFTRLVANVVSSWLALSACTHLQVLFMWLLGLSHCMVAVSQEQVPQRTREKLHHLLWTSIVSHMASSPWSKSPATHFQGEGI